MLYSDLLHSVSDVSREDLQSALQQLLQESKIYQYFSQYESFFVHHTDIANWATRIGETVVQPSSFLCMEGQLPIDATKHIMTKKIVYSIVSNPGISLVVEFNS